MHIAAMAKSIPARKRIHDWREARGLTQEQLAARCEMPQSKISRIETGTIEVDVSDLEVIVGKGLGLTMVEFYGVQAPAPARAS